MRYKILVGILKIWILLQAEYSFYTNLPKLINVKWALHMNADNQTEVGTMEQYFCIKKDVTSTCKQDPTIKSGRMKL